MTGSVEVFCVLMVVLPRRVNDWRRSGKSFSWLGPWTILTTLNYDFTHLSCQGVVVEGLMPGRRPFSTRRWGPRMPKGCSGLQVSEDGQHPAVIGSEGASPSLPKTSRCASRRTTRNHQD